MPYEPRIGDYGVVKTNGFFGLLIRIGTTSRWNHSIVYIGNGKAVSADPTGVKIVYINDYRDIAWNKHETLTEEQRNIIADTALSFVGRPYDFFTIALLALRILGLRLNLPIFTYLAKKEGFICSELVAEAYDKADVILSDKPDYLIVPGDLAERLIYQ
jgi:uncharacterized protein YycO